MQPTERRGSTHSQPKGSMQAQAYTGRGSDLQRNRVRSDYSHIFCCASHYERHLPPEKPRRTVSLGLLCATCHLCACVSLLKSTLRLSHPRNYCGPRTGTMKGPSDEPVTPKPGKPEMGKAPHIPWTRRVT